MFRISKSGFITCAILFSLTLSFVCPGKLEATKIEVNGRSGVLEIREVEKNCVRITLKPVDYKMELSSAPGLAQRNYPLPSVVLYDVKSPVRKRIGNLNIEVTTEPLRITIKNRSGQQVQDLTLSNDGGFSFSKSSDPILGMGEGGPRPEKGTNWRTAPVQYDRNGSYDEMIPRWQSDAYGSRNPVPLMIGTEGWAVFVATPWGEIDLRGKEQGLFKPLDRVGQKVVQTVVNQSLNQGKGLPSIENYMKGVLDIFVFDAHNPGDFMLELSRVTGPSVMPPLWSLGYMQSHRTLTDENQMISIVDSFRNKRIPVDAVIYLGTGFCPRGWNTKQPSFDFNPEVFKRRPEDVIGDLHRRNVKVVVHIVPWDRDKLPTLYGSIPPSKVETQDQSHIVNYWQQHVNLIDKGIDAFWPDEGDWFNLDERIERHKMYYQGPISTKPNIRPWSLHRNGYIGIAQWGGWIWSGDTESSWKTLEAQIAVGLNHSLSIAPFWGSDIGGFYPNPEKTGELYARWFQFGAFCGSFRSHGRTWFTALPWGFGLADMGPREGGGSATSGPESDRRNPSQLEMNNPAIEPITRKYAVLRYQLMPYTYSLAWEAHSKGLPPMRALWLQYPEDKKAVALGDEYMWGSEILVAPVYEKGATSRKIYLPHGIWYDWWSDEKIQGGQDVIRKVDLSVMPIYVSAGAIIPFDTVRQYTGEMTSAPTTLKVFTGADGEFTWYEDDGISLDYLNGKGKLTSLKWNEEKRTLTIEPGVRTGDSKKSAIRNLIIELKPESKTRRIVYEEKKIIIRF